MGKVVIPSIIISSYRVYATDVYEFVREVTGREIKIVAHPSYLLSEVRGRRYELAILDFAAGSQVKALEDSVEDGRDTEGEEEEVERGSAEVDLQAGFEAILNLRKRYSPNRDTPILVIGDNKHRKNVMRRGVEYFVESRWGIDEVKVTQVLKKHFGRRSSRIKL